MASKIIVFVLENLDFLNFFPPPRNNNTNRTFNRKNIQHPLRYPERGEEEYKFFTFIAPCQIDTKLTDED